MCLIKIHVTWISEIMADRKIVVEARLWVGGQVAVLPRRPRLLVSLLRPLQRTVKLNIVHFKHSQRAHRIGSKSGTSLATAQGPARVLPWLSVCRAARCEREIHAFPSLCHNLAILSQSLYSLQIQCTRSFESRYGIKFLLLFHKLSHSGGGCPL